MFGDIHPDGVFIKRVPIRVKSFERVVVSRVVAVHRSVVLVTENDPRTGNALSRGFGALSADRLLFPAFQLTPTAGETAATVR
jgi:hypothetical protein